MCRRVIWGALCSGDINNTTSDITYPVLITTTILMPTDQQGGYQTWRADRGDAQKKVVYWTRQKQNRGGRWQQQQQNNN